MNKFNDDTMRLFSGKRILVFEDGFLLSEEAAARLANVGAVVLGPVSTADQALDYLESEQIDAVVMDVALEPEAVLPLIAELEQGAIPFIFALSDNPRLDSKRFAGFVLSARHRDLSTIAEALFLRRSLEQ
jgi:DNA-binding response OmpR family regulator